MSLQDAQDALAMIQEAQAEGHAATITFKREVGGGVYNPDTGEFDKEIVEFTGVAVILPASKSAVEAFDVRFDDGTLIESRLRALLIAAHGMKHEPLPGDTVIFPDGKAGVLLGCTPFNPGGQNPIIYQGTAHL